MDEEKKTEGKNLREELLKWRFVWGRVKPSLSVSLGRLVIRTIPYWP